ncbi:tyrosine-type recombinase/integrase [Jatrophihabitans sp. YIM 134969]
MYVDSLKNHQSRTIPTTSNVAEIVERWAAEKSSHEWLFSTSSGTALREGNWKRQVGWQSAKTAVGRPTLRVHDLRHTAASIWLVVGRTPRSSNGSWAMRARP